MNAPTKHITGRRTKEQVFTARRRVHDNAMSFSNALREAGKQLEETAFDYYTSMIVKIWSDIVTRTPVADKNGGRLRGNWQIGTTYNNSQLDRKVDENYSPDKKEAWDIIWGKKTVVIFNNLPYAEQIEAGSSGKAPQGMVAEALAKVKSGIISNSPVKTTKLK